MGRRRKTFCEIKRNDLTKILYNYYRNSPLWGSGSHFELYIASSGSAFGKRLVQSNHFTVQNDFGYKYIIFSDSQSRLVLIFLYDIVLLPKDSSGMFCYKIFSKEHPEFASPVDEFSIWSHVSNLYLYGFNASKVESMQSMFACIQGMIYGISQWNTSNVIDMSYAFFSIGSFMVEIEYWDVSNVVNFRRMFSNTLRANVIDIRKWNMQSAVFLDGMFADTSAKVLGINQINTKNATSIAGIFYYYRYGNLDVSTWNTSKVVCWDYAFCLNHYVEKQENFDVSHLDTSKATSMEYTFVRVKGNLKGFENLRTYNVKNFIMTFSQLEGNIDLSKLDGGSCGFTQNMFSNSKIDVIDLRNFNISVNNMIKDSQEGFYAYGAMFSGVQSRLIVLSDSLIKLARMYRLFDSGCTAKLLDKNGIDMSALKNCI